MIATRTATGEETENLRKLLRDHSMRIAPEGEFFTLASGRQSKLYFDSKHVTLSPEGVLAVGRLFLDQADRWGAEAIGGLAAGAIPIGTAAMAAAAIAGRTDVRSFYVRDQKKEHGTREQVFQSFSSSSGELVDSGSRVLVVDDVLTTGKSIGTATEVVLDRGAQVVAIVVLVDRGEGGATKLRERFRMPVVAIFKADQDGNLSLHDGEVF